MLTTKGKVSDVERAIQIGADAISPKPVELSPKKMCLVSRIGRCGRLVVTAGMAQPLGVDDSFEPTGRTV